MKSYYCKRLYEEINFDAENVYVCCGKKLGPSIETPNKSNMNISEYCKKLIKWKFKSAQNAYLGNISPQCKDCIELEDREITFFDFFKMKFLPFFYRKKFRIKNIIIKSYRQCELSCIYCLEKKYTKGKQTNTVEKSEFYDFLPILNSLIEQNLLDKNDLRLEIQGGSFSVWDEFIPVLSKIKNHGISNILYHTNAVKYIPEIAELSQITNSAMSIPLDCGCAESYKKIKGSDLFNIAVENIIKYANSGISISCKYIIVKNINDNEQELSNFLDTIKEIRSKINNKDNISIMLDIDFRESLAVSNYAISDKNLSLFKHAIEFCKENGINIGFQDFIKKKLN